MLGLRHTADTRRHPRNSITCAACSGSTRRSTRRLQSARSRSHGRELDPRAESLTRVAARSDDAVPSPTCRMSSWILVRPARLSRGSTLIPSTRTFPLYDFSSQLRASDFSSRPAAPGHENAVDRPLGPGVSRRAPSGVTVSSCSPSALPAPPEGSGSQRRSKGLLDIRRLPLLVCVSAAGPSPASTARCENLAGSIEVLASARSLRCFCRLRECIPRSAMYTGRSGSTCARFHRGDAWSSCQARSEKGVPVIRGQ